MKKVAFGFALLCVIALASGCGSGGHRYVAPSLPTASSLPATCTAATVGTAYTCTISVSGGKAPFRWTVTGLPAGLTSNASGDTATSVTISGTPQAPVADTSAVASRRASRNPAAALASSTTSTVQVSLTDAKSTSASLSFGITVSMPPALSITTTSLAGGTAGTAYSATVTATGGVTPYSWTATGLPTGLTLSSATPSATISGTTDDVGSFTVKATVTDSESPTVSVSATFTLTIAHAAALSISTTSLAGGTAGTAYTATVTATGGVTPYSWTATGLPTGLTLTSATPSATISGTTDAVGTVSVKATVTDSESPAVSASATFSLTIAQAAALSISTTSLPSGTVNSSYSEKLSATGGVTPYQWTKISGALPTGLTLSTDGTISGTPTATGDFSFGVTLKDAESPAQTASATVSITINAVSAGLNITTASPLPGATEGSSYTTAISASGGTPPYTWTLGSGSTLPAGLSLNSASPSASISGTPTATGTFQFTVDVKDSAGTPATASASFQITVTGTSSFTCPDTWNPLVSLCGSNFLEVQGYRNSAPIMTAVVFLADNSGNVISGEEFTQDTTNGYVKHTITGGSYTTDSNGDGRGQLTVTDSTGAAATFRFVNHSAGNYKPGAVEQFDSSGTLANGVILNAPTITAVPQIPASTVLTVEVTGFNGAGKAVGMLGSFEVGSTGCDGSAASFNSVSGEPIVVNSGGTVTTGLTATGSCTAADALGVGTAQITLSGGTPFTNNTLHFTYFEYTTSGTTGSVLSLAVLMGSDALATNQPVLGGPGLLNDEAGQITGSLFAKYCSPACVGESSGITSSGGAVEAVMQFVATAGSGNSGTLTGTYDQNSAGTITTSGTWPYTAYTVDSYGVGTLTGSGQPTIHFAYSANGAYLLDESAQVGTGSFDEQNSATLEDVGSPYVFGGSAGSPPATQFVGFITPTGTVTSGTFPGTVDVISSAGLAPGVTASGTYTSISATGRGTGTATFTNGSSVKIVIQVARHRRFFILDVQSAKPYLLDVSEQ
jgi:hypothetical protein